MNALYSRGVSNAIRAIVKTAESMLEKEKEVICEFSYAVLNEHINGTGPTPDEVYCETFNTENE